jgi:dihydrofolate reductase
VERIIVAQFITLDGVVEDPDGSDGTGFGGWALRHGRQAIAGDKFGYGPILQTGVFVFGRRTWEHFSTLWPGRDDPFARALNAADKAVATHSVLDLDRWQNSRRVEGDLLTDAHAVDEYRLRVFPIATGAGRRLFPNGCPLALVRVEQIGPTILAIYTPER